MPKATTLQGNFNAGELSPLLFGRTDSPRYKQGLETAINYIPTLQGPLARRPGTKYAGTVKNSAQPPVFIPFNFSETQAYSCEFGNNYIRFWVNGGQVLNTASGYKITLATYLGNYNFYATRSNTNPQGPYEVIAGSSAITIGQPVEVPSPYAYTDVPLIRWAQIGNTLYLVHPNYPPYKLVRFGQQFWDLKQVYFQDGPYLPLNSYSTLGDQANVTLSTGSVTTIPGAQDQVGVITNTFSISGAATDPVSSGQIQITTSANHNFITGQKVCIEGVTGTTEANNRTLFSGGTQPTFWQVKVTSSTTFLLLGSTFVNTYVSGGTVAAALFDLHVNGAALSSNDIGRPIAIYIAGTRYWGTIDVIPSTAEATFYVGFDSPDPAGSTVTTAFQLGVYSIANGYPAAVCFHQNRLVLAGCPSYPQEIDGSFSGQYENFAASVAQGDDALQVNDDNAFQFTLASSDTNALFWLKSTAQALLAGSYTSEWAMSPSSSSDALTPTNFNAVQTSFFGSANADAVAMGNAVLYISRAQRKVREMNFFFQVGTFRSTDLTELSEHITNPGITKLVVQKETQPLLWAIREDGALLSMIYNRDDASLQAGWTRHYLGGRSDASGTPPIVLSACVIPSQDISFDQLWLMVQRYINGSTVITVEYMTKIFDDLILQEDAFQGDCGGTYDNPVTISAITIASPCVVTANAHGFSNGQRIRITGVTGLSKSTTDANGNVTISNLVNETTFLVANSTTNTFSLTDYLGNAISSVGYGSYISGGQVRALVTSVTGITWLENETVGLLLDGGLASNVVVSNSGVITLPFPAAKVQIGYPFLSQGKMLRIEGGAADGTSIGKTRRTARAAIQMHRIGDLSIGTNFNNLLPVKFLQADNQQADEATPLFSGIKRDGLESAYDFESQICFQQSSMLPGMITSITSFMEEQDV